MQEEIISKAASQFGTGKIQIEKLGEGLIHRTFRVKYSDPEQWIVLQCINQNTFPQPENIIHNYRTIYNYLQHLHPGRSVIPSMILTNHGKLFHIDIEGNFWRATEYMPNTYSIPVSKNEKEAFWAAKCFGRLVNDLSGLAEDSLHTVIPGFHDLNNRYRQFETAVKNANIKRLLPATHLIAELRQRRYLLEFYNEVISDESFKKRFMHHDCKINNVLFDKDTVLPVCAVDLDTVMSGYFFSDLGDMIRTMACSLDENSVDWENLQVDKNLYDSILRGYLEGTENVFTKKEIEHLHYSGLLITFMQSLRFLADYLNNDVYYNISYPEQNLNRALNQLLLLEKLEALTGINS